MAELPGSKNLSWCFGMCAVALMLVLSWAGLAGAAPSVRGGAYMLQIDGAIGPATAAYVSEGLERARDEGAQLVIMEMDTPGGLDKSMREIIQAILAMPVPVVTYVHPSGARAASAGTYILCASHVAAMAPGTNLGAATPIQIGAVPGQPDSRGGQGAGKDNAAAGAPKSAGERKAVNDAVAYIRSLAELRGRNADWAEQAVRDAASLSARAALERNVVDIVAADVPSLLGQLDGRKVVVNGRSRTLETTGIALVRVEPDWTTRFLGAITDPNIALMLMMIGIYGLFFEFWNPGSIVPGTVGAISLLIGLYALAALPVDFAGLALIVLGLGLMVAEAFAPSFGALGIGGIAAFIFGAAILFDTGAPGFRINWSVLAGVAVFSAGLIIVVARTGIRSLRRPVATGREELIGASGKVLDWEGGSGHVFVHSERWNAAGPASLPAGAMVMVRDIDGLQLSVVPEASDLTGEGEDG
ncbi:NfeD family protein [Novosphingobium mangrovi (ex Huang et al. 2023)]|uniref:Nodulation protein NfeD n=1 Tax=Novosphingobium mangrovi (ex Huang et al. 2023) TaxID=2976432 RepID=A0ABT2I9I2_9SPHN|nr:nodulation protein NfeD [Novosphingobium mangrovi (ex Huang et al. 2023)]MCT2401483.1 nodulation protein NfeD [Novosphingobium mangrovi (ex Huang et al. 2023)]